jgi:hypothetical protein
MIIQGLGCLSSDGSIPLSEGPRRLPINNFFSAFGLRHFLVLFCWYTSPQVGASDNGDRYQDERMNDEQ